ncbi:MAG: hypothetical protein ACYC6L_17205 [Anaerolineae bacterium]
MGWKRFLAIFGTILAWLPILATLATSMVVSVRSGVLHLDYLMPAELAFFAVGSAILLLVASLMAHKRRRFFAWGLGSMVVLLLLSLGAAVITGLASGAVEAVGWRLVLVASLMAGYDLMVVAVAVGGISLSRRLFKKD